jgi:uncharacterized membrane protein
VARSNLLSRLNYVHIRFERTLQRDALFGLRQLVDIALTALSPSINDPYTGVQVVHHISAVDAVLASRPQFCVTAVGN